MAADSMTTYEWCRRAYAKCARPAALRAFSGVPEHRLGRSPRQNTNVEKPGPAAPQWGELVLTAAEKSADFACGRVFDFYVYESNHLNRLRPTEAPTPPDWIHPQNFERRIIRTLYMRGNSQNQLFLFKGEDVEDVSSVFRKSTAAAIRCISCLCFSATCITGSVSEQLLHHAYLWRLPTASSQPVLFFYTVDLIRILISSTICRARNGPSAL